MPLPASEPHCRFGWMCHLGLDAPYAHILLPAILFILSATYAVSLWQAEAARQRQDIVEATKLVAPVAAEQVESVILEQFASLSRLLRQLGAHWIATPEQFTLSAASVQDRVSSLQIVGWLDEHGVVRAVTPPGNNELRVGESVQSLPLWGDVYNEAFNSGRRNKLLAGQWDDRPGVWACLPYLGGQQEGVRARGAIVVRLDLSKRLPGRFGAEPWNSFHYLLLDEAGTVIYGSSNEPAATAGDRPFMDHHSVTQPVQIYTNKWSLSVRPTAEFIANRRPVHAGVVLIAGLGIATLLSGGVFQAMLHRRRNRQSTESQIAALEVLSRVSAAMSEQPGASTEVLAQLARVTARLMNMSSLSLTLYDPREETMRVVQRDALPNPDDRDVYHLNELPYSAACMRSGRPILFSDILADGTGFTPEHAERFGMRALLLLPLMAGERPMGVLLLADRKPRRFTQLDRRLVDLWTAEAGAILSNRELYEGMNAALKSLQQLLQQRETLYTVHSRISDAASLREALDLVAELTPQALDVETCLVCLSQSNSETFEIVAVTPGRLTGVARQDLRFECSTCLSVLRSGQVQVIEDGEACPIRGLSPHGPLLFIPLRSRERTIGLLSLMGRAHSGTFHADQIRAAELYAARAATAIENTQLYEQTRQQAESNAMLLRELNHRVGNNFASIIGLLKVAASELPHDSRQGLERAAHRVHMMARAHELFSGGARSVRLGDLLQMILASLAAPEEFSVRFSTELEDPAVRLFSHRAITLAMVLHELAYNALEHALYEGGELLVRSRHFAGLGQMRIAIDIIDRATDCAAAAPVKLQHEIVAVPSGAGGNGHGARPVTTPHDVRGRAADRDAGHTGIGLQLVRNLVARELRGNFSLTRTEVGTTATVEFPLEQESECHP